MGSQRAWAVVLDAGALIAFERNDRRIRRLVELASEHARPLHAPQAWSHKCGATEHAKSGWPA